MTSKYFINEFENNLVKNMSGRTWKLQNVAAEEVKKYLLEQGGVEEEVGSVHEKWKIKFSDSTFTYYKKGTLYATPSKSLDPAVENAWNFIDSIAGRYVAPSKDFLIGLDETGKGEIIGHIILTGIVFPKEIFNQLDLIVGPANTKKKHDFGFWDNIFKQVDCFRSSGLDFILETIPPWEIDKYNINKMMDVTYQRILSEFFRRIQMDRCRIVIDDYGVGPTLNRFINFLRQQGAEVIVAHDADENYLEAKIASLISKRRREEFIKRINEDPDFQINGLSIGSGNAGDLQTINWLKEWYSAGKEWPWFVKRSFKTVREIEGRATKVEKLTPPIKENLLSTEFIEKFNKGHLSIKALSIVCPACGNTNKLMNFAIFEKGNGSKVSGMKCPSCGKLVDYAGMTLRYYCGYVVPDSSIIRRGLISKDLESSRFFEGFTVVIPAIVRKECDTEAGKRELGRIADFASKGRIKLEAVGKMEEISTELSSIQRDEIITDIALKYNAILITADTSMKAYSISKDIFTIFI
ncbi:MAG: hypothetical protein QXU11_08100 [Thermoproteota archaeon]